MKLTGNLEEGLWNRKKRASAPKWPFWGARQTLGVRPGMAMAAVSAGTESRLGNGQWLCSLPPENQRTLVESPSYRGIPPILHFRFNISADG